MNNHFPMYFWLLFITLTSCSKNTQPAKIICTDNGCEGKYMGPEFVNGEDVAHQFSNTMSKKVGDKLKEMYISGKYVKVDFYRIVMSTKGMGSGSVTYKLRIPFKDVQEKCRAFTSFDHVGGWNHAPALTERVAHLQYALMEGETLDVSPLLVTKEGLQEHWIQWKNKVVQKDCEK